MKFLSLLFLTALVIGGTSPAIAGHRVNSDCLDIDCDEYDRNTYLLKNSDVEPGDVYYDYRNSNMDYEDSDMEDVEDMDIDEDNNIIKGAF